MEILFFIALLVVAALLASLVAKGNKNSVWRVIRISLFAIFAGAGLLLYADGNFTLTLLGAGGVLLGGAVFISALGFRK